MSFVHNQITSDSHSLIG